MKKAGLILTLIGTFLLPSLMQASVHSRDFHKYNHSHLSIAIISLIAGSVLLVSSWIRPIKNNLLNPNYLPWICVVVSFILSVGRSIDPKLWGCSWDIPPEAFGIIGILWFAFASRKNKEPYDIREAFSPDSSAERK